jgi:hypothetical protein
MFIGTEDAATIPNPHSAMLETIRRASHILPEKPRSRLTLGFTVAHYNIGGGDDPTHTHMRPMPRRSKHA